MTAICLLHAQACSFPLKPQVENSKAKGHTKQGSTAIQRCSGTLSIGELNKCYACRMVVVPQEPDLGDWACSTMSAIVLESNLAVRA